jgi:hypothetical protein
MASGMLTKQAEFQTAKFLNDVNDAAAGGVIVSLPAGVPSPQVSQTIPGDRICLDDATALALSDTAVGTLLGGVYMYVGTTAAATANPAVGSLAFWPAANIGVSYVATSDAQPTTALPNYLAGIFINAITKGNFGWIQVAGVANVLFDSALTAISSAAIVVAKVSAAVASTADAGIPGGATPTAAQVAEAMAAVIGTAIGTPATSTVSKVFLTRGAFMGRI